MRTFFTHELLPVSFYTLRIPHKKMELAALDVALSCPGHAAYIPRCLDPDVQELVKDSIIFAFPDGQGGYVGSFSTRFYQM